MRRIFFACVLLVATGATGTQALSKPGSELNPYTLSDTIIVTANRLVTSVRKTASSVTVVTAEQIKQSQATMVTDILRTVPGLSVMQSGGLGQQTSIFMRGGNSEHTLVLIDGVEINDPSSPNMAVNLANLSVDNIERIEVLRGPQSVLYGSDAVAGVIHIFTKRGLGKPSVTLSAESGAFSTFKQQLSIRSGTKDVDYSLMIGHQKSEGISASEQVTVDPGDGRTIVRITDIDYERDGYDNTTVSASFGLRPSEKVEMRFAGRMTKANIDLDQGDGLLDDPNFAMTSKERFFSARISHELMESVWSHRVGLYITHYKRRAVDFVDDDHASNASQTEYEGRRVKHDWQHVLYLGARGRATFGIDTENDEMSQSLFFGSAWGDYYSAIPQVSARTTGAYALLESDISHQWFSTIGLRTDDHEQFGSHTTYRATSAYLLDRIGLKLKVAYGTSFKVPSLFQIYDDATGNRDLKPETSEGWETGFEERLGETGLSFGFTYFHTSFKDLIQYEGRMENRASVAVRGGEIFGALDLGRVSARVDYTNTLTRDDTNAARKQMLRRPRHNLTATITGRVSESTGLNLKLIHVGRRIDVFYAAGSWVPLRVELNSYTRVDVSGTYQLSDSMALNARIENLLNAKYQEVLTYGSAPRAGYLGFSVTL